MNRRRHPAAQLIGAASAVLGAFMVVRPQLVSRAVSGGTPVSQDWVRLLGARYLAQGAAQLRWPRPGVLAGSAVVDGLHAASMLALAAGSPGYRRPASLSAGTATASAALTTWTAQRWHRAAR